MSRAVSTDLANKKMPLNELVDLAWRTRLDFRPDIFESVYPAATLPISVTGGVCSLKCAHCGGRYLKHMATLDTMNDALRDESITGILMSGGSDLAGMVPIARWIDAVRYKLERVGRPISVNAHPGMVNRQDALAIAEFANVISFDFVIDDETIRAAFGGNWTGKDYINTFGNLRMGKSKVVPHILAGLYKGKIRGEYEAVKFLTQEGVDEFIFIVFIPTPETKWEKLSPPSVQDVIRLISWTRLQNPKAKISLGCMRPKGKYRQRLDPLAVSSGVDAVVLPSSPAVREAKDRGLTVVKKEGCCAFD